MNGNKIKIILEIISYAVNMISSCISIILKIIELLKFFLNLYSKQFVNMRFYLSTPLYIEYISL